MKRSPTLGALVCTKLKCIKLIVLGKITLVPVAFLMALSIYSCIVIRYVKAHLIFGEDTCESTWIKTVFVFLLPVRVCIDAYLTIDSYVLCISIH